MRHLPIIGVFAAVAALLVGGISCSDETKFRSLCATDQQCIDEHGGNPNWRCDKTLGDCVCTADAACVGENEHCETYPGGDGRCHPNVSCEWNNDCSGNAFCDTVTRYCRVTGCTDDLQCDLGQICDPITSTCVNRCRSHGDCRLGDTCMCAGEDGNLEPCPPCEGDDRSNCAIGQCVSSTCADKSFCALGDFCVPGDAPGELASCESGITTETPFCANCANTPGGEGCGSDGPNFCLLDQSDPARATTFCGVDCSEGGDDACPNGFSCRDVLRLYGDTCVSDAQCAPMPNAPACNDDSDCPLGARCAGGRCAGRCAVSEQGQFGYCTCVQNSDCPQQSCGSDGRCTITRERCTPPRAGELDPCMGKIFCKNNGNVGYCHIGRNCAPDEGVTCADVRCDQNPGGCGG